MKDVHLLVRRLLQTPGPSMAVRATTPCAASFQLPPPDTHFENCVGVLDWHH